MRRPFVAWAARFWRRLRGARSPRTLALSVAVGLFVGSLPLYGLHFPLCVLACWPFGLDVIAAYLAAQISNPWFAPFLITLEARVGGFVLERGGLAVERIGTRELGDLFERTLVGGLVVGLALSLVGGLVTWLIASRTRAGGQSALDFSPTIARYRRAPRADRWYVDLKLRTDPVVEQLTELGCLGRVIDAGSGRGQNGLFLRDLARLTQLEGFDPDERKIELARRAAAADALYTIGDLQSFTPASAPVDSVLLIDVLHYLEPHEQAAALARIKAWLAPGGRVILREVDARPGLKSAFTRAIERVATVLGYNRATRPLGFRPLNELIEELERLGFRCARAGGSVGTPFDNALVVAQLPTTASRSSAPVAHSS